MQQLLLACTDPLTRVDPRVMILIHVHFVAAVRSNFFCQKYKVIFVPYLKISKVKFLKGSNSVKKKTPKTKQNTTRIHHVHEYLYELQSESTDNLPKLTLSDFLSNTKCPHNLKL